MRALTVLLSLRLLALVASASLADEASLRGVGGAIEVMEEHPSVVMERMDVHIDYWPSHARVDCDFVFRNTGGRTTVKMGFPEVSYYQSRRKRPVGFDWFVTWVDGRRVRTRIEGLKWVEPEHHWSRWRVKHVTFAPGQARRVRVAYEAPTAANGEGQVFFGYQIGTGASWKGPIRDVRVRIDAHYDPRRAWLVPPDVDRPRREGGLAFHRVGRTAFEAKAHYLEPTDDDDLDLAYDPWYGGLTFDGVPPDWSDAYFEGGRLWVPATELGRAMHGSASWSAGAATLSVGQKQVRVVPGSRWIEVNGKRELLPAAPRIRRRVLYIPLRPIATVLGARVGFDPEWRTVNVSLPAAGVERR